MREELFERYQLLQQYVGWTDDDAVRLRAAGPALIPAFPALVEDFYNEIDRHDETRHVLRGGLEQQMRLKRSLLGWLEELVAGEYNADYVERRWRVGHRHVQIGLDQVFTNAALSRLRRRLAAIVEQKFQPAPARELQHSLDLLIDLDLAIIQLAYQTEFAGLQKAIERAERLAETERVQLALVQSEQALQAVLQAAPCMIVVLNRAGLVRYFSPYAEQLTGFHRDETLGCDYLEMFVPEASMREEIRQDIERTLSGAPTRGYTNPIRDRSGLTHWMVWNTQPIADYQGESVVLAVGQDITMLREAQKRMVQTERLAAIGEMITGLAHESRNALQRSQACLEMLSMELQDRPGALNLVERIQNAQDSLHQLYEEVRDYAAPIGLKLANCNVRRILEDTWDHLSVERANRNVSLIFISSEGIPRCQVDALKLEQVFRNVLENAIFCGANPVKIEVCLRDASLDGRAALSISIRDNGPGLTPESRVRIFEPFFTTKTKGTGLGMAISKRVVEAHSGTISLGDAAAGGAEIIVTLPREGPTAGTL